MTDTGLFVLVVGSYIGWVIGTASGTAFGAFIASLLLDGRHRCANQFMAVDWVAR